MFISGEAVYTFVILGVKNKECLTNMGDNMVSCPLAVGVSCTCFLHDHFEFITLKKLKKLNC